MGPLIPLVAVGIDAGVKAFSNIKDSNQKADAAQKEAADKRIQAGEVERRSGVRRDLMQREGEGILSSQAGAYAKAGVELDGSPLLVMSETHKQVNAEIYEMQEESRFRAEQLRAGATFQDSSAGDMRTAGYVNAGSAVTGNLFKAYGLFDNNTYKGGKP